MENLFVKTGHKNVLINFDLENQHIEQLLGYKFDKYDDNEGFYVNMLLNCDLKHHEVENYMEIHAMHQPFTPRTILVTEEIWYNLVQLCYQNKLIMIDGEMLATNLPLCENKRFDEVWDSEEMYSDIRKDLKA